MENTSGRSERIFHVEPIELVRHGMSVVDANGDDLGSVDVVQMGDSGAATAQGSPGADATEMVENQTGFGLSGSQANVGVGLPFLDEAEPELEEPLRSRYLRRGYIKVDGPIFSGPDRYVLADQIREVTDDRVILRVPKDQLPREAE